MPKVMRPAKRFMNDYDRDKALALRGAGLSTFEIAKQLGLGDGAVRRFLNIADMVRFERTALVNMGVHAGKYPSNFVYCCRLYGKDIEKFRYHRKHKPIRGQQRMEDCNG